MAAMSDEEKKAAAIAYYKSILTETSSLRRIIAGEDEEGRALYVPADVKLDAIKRMGDIIEEFGGEPARQLKAQMRLFAPEAFALLAQLALGLDKNGNRRLVEPDIQKDARDSLIGYGIVKSGEFRTIRLPELLNRIDDFVRAMSSIDTD